MYIYIYIYPYIHIFIFTNIKVNRVIYMTHHGVIGIQTNSIRDPSGGDDVTSADMLALEVYDDAYRAQMEAYGLDDYDFPVPVGAPAVP